MSEPTDSGGLPSPLDFESGSHRYSIQRPLVSHPDYDTLLLASRQHVRGGPLKRVILKPILLGEERELRARALEEVNLSGFLRHPNIARVLGSAFTEEMAYVVMDMGHGRFLLSIMDAAVSVGSKLSHGFAAYVAAEVADALDHAHRAVDDEGRPLHLVHRAVGPMRIRLGYNGRVQLTNFGAAWSELMGRIPTPPRTLRGDPAYTAPEILRGFEKPKADQRDPLTPPALDGRADIFSLGLVLLEMLLARYPLDPPDRLWHDLEQRFPPEVRGERPSSLLPLETLANRLLHFGPEEVQQATEELPEPLRRIVARALRPEPAERYQTAGQLRDELRDFLQGAGQQPYGAKQAKAEVNRLFGEASDLDKLQAYPIVEIGVLPVPPDMDLENLDELDD
ncbi:protein kinase domain-containing protein [Archangium lansingense]|uniref:Protein kinase n=1 Tax=Archangium lansingense TaxID=2995310 RepID=A0ABT3ZW57_9BACT|nr:protein kinase [Archangium lansinium]MCY1073635.1 protein kinase [Archangium lansinium]